MARLVVCAFILLFFSAAAFAGVRGALVVKKLRAIPLSEGWVDGTALGPNIFLLIQPGAELGKKDESTFGIQHHDRSAKISDLEKSLVSLKAGQKIGTQKVKSVERMGKFTCLAFESSENISQCWLFSKTQAYVATETGQRKVGDAIRKRYFQILENEVQVGEEKK